MVAVLSPQAMAGFILLVMCIVAHVAGNAIGTRLRDNGDQAAPLTPNERARLFRPPAPEDIAPATVLSLKRGPGLVVLIFSLVGAVVGALAGGGLLAWLNWQHMNLTIGIFCFTATAAIGAVAGFCTASFTTVLWSAHRDALKVSSGK